MFLKKTLGQHFLSDPRILEKIVAAAHLTPQDTVLEVGPGEGTLTAFLLGRAGKVIAVEKDDRCIPLLQKKFASDIASGRLQLINADILTLPVNSQELKVNSFKVVANLPYYITGQFLRKFLQCEHQPSSMTLLLQKEVAKRILAADGKASILSISVKCYGKPRYIDTIKAGSFSPPPKVDSAILAIENISKDFFESSITYSSFPKGGGESASRRISKSLPSEDGGTSYRSCTPFASEDGCSRSCEAPSIRFSPFKKGRINGQAFFSLLKRGFAHPRKLLASNLGLAPEALEACGISKGARAENLSLEQWKYLALQYS